MESPQLENLLCLESIGISDPPFADDDDEALQKFNETVKVTGYHKCTYRLCYFCMVQDLDYFLIYYNQNF